MVIVVLIELVNTNRKWMSFKLQKVIFFTFFGNKNLGDSTVLYQQTAKYLIDKYRKYSKNPNLETAKQFLINVLNIQSEDSESNPFNFYSQTFLFR